MKMLAAGALVLGVGLFAWTIVSRGMARGALAQRTIAAATPTVATIKPQHGPADEELVLPGTVQAYYEAPIYARTSGYLKTWYTDIGARAARGQVLAEIDTPEVDDQLRQARADLATAQATLKLAAITADRTEVLLKTRSVSTQERDNAVGSLNSDTAIVQSREAAVAQLEQLQSFEKVEAPFDGIVTARNIDVGALIAAGGAAPARELFHMVATDTLRIYVSVPETYSPAMHENATPKVTLDEYPGQTFDGILVRTSNAIDPASRTLLVEVDVKNDDGRLLPGAYTSVHFTLPGAGRSVTIPANTLLFRKEGLQVGVLRGDKVELVPVRIGRDYGDIVEIVDGLQPGDEVVLNPADSLASGTAVRVNRQKDAVAAP
jgi:RND family efflux transporter MFP subunit